ncbi:MAG TPA: flagellar hook protein FlgE [Negativicutes bacterium]|nr:flagellar hook protein FlgE [Negativicutes bacterium]
MLMSLYAGVSGLKSQQTKLNVIANNISNVNTTGYKQQTVSFADLLSQTISAASRPTATTGGTNPKQIGLGTSVAAISTNMSTGSTQYTGISTDVAISGEGFFIVQGGSDGEYQFTRAGNFEYDVDGNLTVNGYKVCGWQDYDEATDGTYAYNTQTDVQPINLYSDSYNGNKKVMAAKATGEADITATLDSTATARGSDLHDIGAVPAEADATGTLTVYDAQGNKTEVTLKYYKCATGTDSSGDAVTSWYWTATTADGSTLGGTTSGYLLFDADGNVVTTDADYDPTVDLTVQSVAGGTSAVNVSLDMSPASTSAGSSGDGSQSGVSVKSDGYSSGTLSGISIGADGVITGTYDNGESKPLGMIALAVFNNPAGLEKIGDNLYVTTTNSGDFQGGVAVGRGGTSALSTGVLEMSNVDLAQEFSDMMITQRAYQANSKVISTSDDMLEVLMNMIR